LSGLPSALASPAAAACWFVPDRARYGRGALPAEAWLRRLAALNRLVAASCIQSAGHGWLGASYSVAEILTTLYFGCGERQIVLSKGHAAAMQYACLYGLGLLEREQLLAYQDGPRRSRPTPIAAPRGSSWTPAPSARPCPVSRGWPSRIGSDPCSSSWAMASCRRGSAGRPFRRSSSTT
jgi:hypothetical protein